VVDRHLFHVGGVSGAVVWSGPRKLSIRVHPRVHACGRDVGAGTGKRCDGKGRVLP
jgi:hypothetical protein